MGDITRKSGKRKMNENGEQTKQEDAPGRTKRTINGEAGGKNKKRK